MSNIYLFLAGKFYDYMGRKRMNVVGISNSQTQTGAFALILEERGTNRRIPIIIGAYEAQAIALQLENMKPSRPLTHDLFVSLCHGLGVQMKEVFINKFHEGIFYARLICEHDGHILEVDSRTSDAVALAVRFKVPIFCDEKIIEQTAIRMEEPLAPEPEEPEEMESIDEPDDYNAMDSNTLKQLLDKMVEEENFEQASIIRDILKSRGAL